MLMNAPEFAVCNETNTVLLQKQHIISRVVQPTLILLLDLRSLLRAVVTHFLCPSYINLISTTIVIPLYTILDYCVFPAMTACNLEQ